MAYIDLVLAILKLPAILLSGNIADKVSFNSSLDRTENTSITYFKVHIISALIVSQPYLVFFFLTFTSFLALDTFFFSSVLRRFKESFSLFNNFLVFFLLYMISQRRTSTRG